MLYYNKLRYRLMPYIYTLAGKAYHNDYTIMRGLVMDFGYDKNVLEINDQFMLGPSLLVNPVCDYKARDRKVYLPSGSNWYDFYSGNYLEGGKSIQAEAPLNRIPLYVREGSILPVGPEILYTNAKPDSVLTLFVYTGKDGSLVLYEDEGNNYNYEKGAFSSIPLSYSEKTNTLTIGKREGSFKGMSPKKTLRIIRVSKNTPLPFDPDSKPIQTVSYEGASVQVNLSK
jgi:alpha-D-xyloside xylohydrolase